VIAKGPGFLAYSFIALGLCAFAARSQVLSAARLHYLGEIGHLGTQFDERKSVRFGPVTITTLENGSARFQGQDDYGKRWSAILISEGGVGFTDVWQADFDHNSRADLLVATFFPKNGRCVDEITLQFLLFDDGGKPIPWVINSRMPHSNRFPRIPAIVVSAGRDATTKLVVTDCAYSDPPRFGEDRSIVGIYEARDAKWSLSKPNYLRAYVALVKRSYHFQFDHDQLLPTDTTHWLDRGNRTSSGGSPEVQVSGVFSASPECRGVRLPPIVDGHFQRDWKDPCRELGKDRIQLSDGTVCLGWPLLVVDQNDERDIVADPKQLNTFLQELIRQRRSVVLTGQTDAERCSPTALWATR
jgi:hypothetical protein